MPENKKKDKGIFDVFKYKNVPYKELEDEYAKQRIEIWVSKLSPYPKLIKALIDSEGFIDISPLNPHFEYTHDGIPPELFSEVLKMLFPEYL